MTYCGPSGPPDWAVDLSGKLESASSALDLIDFEADAEHAWLIGSGLRDGGDALSYLDELRTTEQHDRACLSPASLRRTEIREAIKGMGRGDGYLAQVPYMRHSLERIIDGKCDALRNVRAYFYSFAMDLQKL